MQDKFTLCKLPDRNNSPPTLALLDNFIQLTRDLLRRHFPTRANRFACGECQLRVIRKTQPAVLRDATNAVTNGPANNAPHHCIS